MRMAVKVIREIVREAPNLHQRIKEARLADGRNAQMLATLCGLSTTYWYQLESGNRRSVSETIIREMEKVLGVDLGLPSFDETQSDRDRALDGFDGGD